MKCDCLVKIVKGILSRLILACDTGPFVTGDPPAIVRLSIIVCALRTSSFVLISVLIITTLPERRLSIRTAPVSKSQSGVWLGSDRGIASVEFTAESV